MWIAAFRGHTDVLKVLLGTNNVDINVESDAKRTPLFRPAANGDIEVAKLLLSHGARQDYTDEDGMSPLGIAKQNGHIEVVAILEENARRIASLLPEL